ncbi:hypothetical protein [Roseibium aggregatum]|uniref:hypothetical protein n=1 Tax=Roseibium aggregatum TaxID=187304 RepID=UPI0025ABDF5E|nr:hypothetical protein [Roseibium aggregatum]WJS03174.1 hypothetical protein QUB73_02550 [Roseibium aggregatum]
MKIEHKFPAPEEAQSMSAGKSIQERLQDLTIDQKRDLFQELGEADEAQLDDWVGGVEQILHMYLYWNYLCRLYGTVDPTTSRVAKEMHLQLHDHLEAAYRIMSTFDDRTREGLGYELEDCDIDELSDEELRDFMQNARAIARSAKRAAEQIQPTRGRPARDDLLEALLSLGCFYEHETGKSPGYSSRPEKRPDAQGYDVYGPFVRFATRVLQIVEPSQSAIDSAVRRYVRQLPRKRRLDASVE